MRSWSREARAMPSNPAAGDYFVARTTSGVDHDGMLYVMVAIGYDHPASVSGPFVANLFGVQD
jgi:hypothetical protein